MRIQGMKGGGESIVKKPDNHLLYNRIEGGNDQ